VVDAVHNSVISRLILVASEKLKQARDTARQVPEQLGNIHRSELESSLIVTEAALKATDDELRGNIAAAHSFIRRCCRFSRDEHNSMFGALAELSFSLEDVEQAAAAADYPESEANIFLPKQYLVPRAPLVAELDALSARLAEFDDQLSALAQNQSASEKLADQNALIKYVVDHAGSQSVAAHELAAERQIDIRGLSHVIEALGRIVTTFVATITPIAARVTRAVKRSASLVGGAGREVVSAGEKVAKKTASLDPPYKVGETFRDFNSAPEMVVVPAGTFLMGSPPGEGDEDEHPQHLVKIERAFAVSRFVITFDDWDAAVELGGVDRRLDDMGWGRGKRPALVSWHDATEYIDWLSAVVGKRYRFLSEAEWEYCCRAGTTTPFYTGNTISRKQAQFSLTADQDAGQTVKVGTFPCNAWGIYDMHGNVWEWCEDIPHLHYQGAPTDGSAWLDDQQGTVPDVGDALRKRARGYPADATYRIIRGGSWINQASLLRSALRNWERPTGRPLNIGFRVARTL
jgi:formylglycine-generating enzyme required for sulfatase activity